MNWTSFLEFTRGPLFYAALLVFIAAWPTAWCASCCWAGRPIASSRRAARLAAWRFRSSKALLIWPFIPWVKNTFNRNPLIYVAGGLFHLGLFVVLILGTAHMLVWKSLLGFGWPTLPLPIVDWLAVVAIAAMIVLFINRLVHPVLKLISGPAEWFNLLFVFLPMISGYILTHHLFFRYEMAYSLHMLAVDWLLIWIPLSRISHFMFYFFSKAIHGAQFGKRAVAP